LTSFRLLVTEPLDGAANMALDEALLLGRLRYGSPPTLRFFAWSPPTISLGYGQRLDGRIDERAAEDLGLGLVRRATGGSAILHEGPDLEITYSVAAGAGDFEGAGDLLDTYRWIGAGLLAGLRALGAPVDMVPVQPSDLAAMPAFCFARTGSFELEVDGKKLVGSAQRRQGAAFLQHGAIMLGAEPGRLRRGKRCLAGVHRSMRWPRRSPRASAARTASPSRRAASARTRRPSVPCWSARSTPRMSGRDPAARRARSPSSDAGGA